MNTIRHTATLLLLGYALAAAAQTFTEWQEGFCEMASGDFGKGSMSGRLTLSNQDQPYAISPMLIGAFFEDINYAADGGLYAEMVQNRDFEYCAADYATPKAWSHEEAWSTSGEVEMEIDSLAPLHPNNSHYARMKVGAGGGCLVNEGYDGFSVRKGEQYLFSCYAKGRGRVYVRIVDGRKRCVAAASFRCNSQKTWKEYRLSMAASADCKDGRLELEFGQGEWRVDMVSLFPKETFRGHRNGLRKDLAEYIANMAPRFLRFPGGCVAHGDGIDNIYEWKGSIGPLYARRPIANIGGYHQTRGLGYYEYFQLCEDLDCEPLPVVAAGVSCQNTRHGRLQSDGKHHKGQEAVPMSEMPQYVQDVLDLVEWARGDARTSPWARMRAEAGHPKPFKLNYLGIGNEDQISEAFKERFLMIYKAVRERYPDIQLIGTAGPDLHGTDFDAGWAFADSLGIDLIDEHGYRPAKWFVDNQYRYDSYSRDRKTRIYLGEWGTSQWAAKMTLEGALAEALYVTNLERNADIVRMASFAPMFCRENQKRWVADMIYFTNDSVMPTASYWVQQLCGRNQGDVYIPAALTLDGLTDQQRKLVSHSVVCDSQTGDIIIKLVNLLPDSQSIELDYPTAQEKARVSVLTGPDMSLPAGHVTESEWKTASIRDYRMPPHSFTVIRLKSKHARNSLPFLSTQ